MIKTAAAILTVLLGIWAGARVYSSRNATHPAPAIKTAVGEASPPVPSDFEAPFDAPSVSMARARIPERLPEFSLADRNGKAVSISHWAGKSLILNFWATWCAPCRREIPLLKALHAQWSPRGVEVVGIAVDYREKVVAYADEFKIPYALLVGEQDALDVVAQLGVDTPVFPFTVFTDNRGQVVALFLGELHQAQADLILGEVDKLNQRRLELKDARRNIAQGLHALAPDSPG